MKKPFHELNTLKFKTLPLMLNYNALSINEFHYDMKAKIRFSTITKIPYSEIKGKKLCLKIYVVGALTKQVRSVSQYWNNKRWGTVIFVRGDNQIYIDNRRLPLNYFSRVKDSLTFHNRFTN